MDEHFCGIIPGSPGIRWAMESAYDDKTIGRPRFEVGLLFGSRRGIHIEISYSPGVGTERANVAGAPFV